MAEHTEQHPAGTQTQPAAQPQPAEGAAKSRTKIMVWTLLALLVVGIVGGGLYFYVNSKTIYIDQSQIEAPLINLSPDDSGVLQAVYVQDGDTVTADEPVAEVGNDIVKAQTSGEIVSINQNIGQYLNTLTGQATVATMIDPAQLRVVGNLDENKGLADIQVGDRATFTVDAFGSQVFKGVVDQVAPTAESGSVVFNISDQRPTQQFAVYVRFDPSQYPELKNGMSARIWVYKQ
jgi:multidrug resistance efflux pump